MIKNKGYLFTLSVCIFTTILFVLSKPYPRIFIDYPLLSISQLFALLGVTLFSLNFLISTRSRFLSRIYGGFDVMFKHHHWYGAISFTLILFHPLFLMLNALPQWDLMKKYIFYSDMFAYNLGITALIVLTLTLIFTLLIKLPYHLWIITHRFLGIFLLIASLHILLIGSDLGRFTPLKLWIFFLLSISVLAVLYRRIFYRLLAQHFYYRVIKAIHRGDILDIYLKPENKPISFFPGQFAFVTFLIPNIRHEPLPFSFASSPKNETLRLTIRALGDQTKRIQEKLKIGVRARLDGPHGLFAEDINLRKNVVFIAGGIGIAPFLSLVYQEKLQPTGKTIHLFSSFSHKTENFCEEELLKIKEKLPGLHVYSRYTDTQPHLTAIEIGKTVGDIEEYSFYLCGPVKMMISLREQLMDLGVHQTKIHFENFSFK